MSLLVGKYWRSDPFVFLLEPRCQGPCGSQKYTQGRKVVMVNCGCWDISLPWSQVNDRRR